MKDLMDSHRVTTNLLCSSTDPTKMDERPDVFSSCHHGSFIPYLADVVRTSSTN